MCGIYGAVHLKQEFNMASLVPKDSYLKLYFDTSNEYFPNRSLDLGYIYFRELYNAINIEGSAS